MTEQRFNHKIPRRTFLKVCAAAAAVGLTACGKTQAAAALPETFAAMRADGTMKQIVGKYLPDPEKYLEVDALEP